MSLPKTTQQYSLFERGSYENLTFHEIPLAPPKPNEVLVKTHAVSLQYRDLMMAEGTYPGALPGTLVPCSDTAGEVIAVGSEVTQWRIGARVSPNFIMDRVTDEMTPAIMRTVLGGETQGVLTQYRSYPAHCLVAIPAHLSYEEAATLPCAAVTAYNALTGGYPAVKAGDTVLVLGSGGVSIFGLQFAVASGATVIALSSSDEKLKKATQLGAKHVINYKTTPEWDAEVLKLTDGKGVDRVIEVGGNATLARSMASVRLQGNIDLVGSVGGLNATPVDIFLPSQFKGLTIRGITIGSVAHFRAMNKLISANPDTTRPVIDKVFEFSEVKAAYAYLESGAHVGKVVIKVT
ncbi:hypothetical protein C8R43DRAFT_1084645 [Mycena crocata]|nr:hypothetical protein C8R43DRAFT_1084645 [Mycena crocata]